MTTVRACTRALLGLTAAALLWPGTASATPECQNFGPGDPLTGGDDDCLINGASPQGNVVDAGAGQDRIHLDTTGGSFSFGALAIGGLYMNFEEVIAEGGNTLTVSFAAVDSLNWTVVSGTTVHLNPNAALGSGSMLLDGTLEVGSNQTLGALGGAGNISLTNGAALTLLGGGGPQFFGTIDGNGSVVMAGAFPGSHQTLTGTNTYTGGTTLLSGELIVTSDANLGAATGGITFNGGKLFLGGFGTYGATRTTTLLAGGGTIDTSNNVTYASNISGAGPLTLTGISQLTLTGNNTYSGATTINGSGTVNLSGGNAIGDNSAVTVGGTGVVRFLNSETIGSLAGTGNVGLLGGTLTTGGNNTSTTFTGGIGNVGALTKTGTGTFNTLDLGYAGLTTVAQGKMIVNGVVTGSVLVQSGATFGGNAAINGDLTNNGIVAPGNSPGSISVAGNYIGGGVLNMEVQFNNANAPVNGTTHDFLSIAGNVTGVTTINVIPFAPSSAPTVTTGNGIELVQVGGTVSSNQFALSGPVVQGGYQYVLKYLPNFSGTLDGFFLQTTVREEIWGHAALLAAGRAMTNQCFGGDERGTDNSGIARRGAVWAKYSGGSQNTGADTGIDMDQDFSCGEGGIDFAGNDELRFGLSGGYGASSGDVTTPLGRASLNGNESLIEAYASLVRDNFFVNLSAGYATTDWTFDGATLAPKSATADGLIASAQVGAHWPLGWLRLGVTGAVKYDGTSCGDSCLVAGVSEDASQWLAKGTLRLDGTLSDGKILPYVALSLSDDLDGGNSVTLGSAAAKSDTGPLFGAEAGVTTFVGKNLALFAGVGITEGLDKDVTGFDGQGGVKLYW